MRPQYIKSLENLKTANWHFTSVSVVGKNVFGLFQYSLFLLLLLPTSENLESLLTWKIKKYYLFVCVRARVRVCVCVWVTGLFGVCMCVFACSLAYPARNAHAPYFNVLYGPFGSPTFSDLSHKRHDFPKNVTERKMCVLILSTSFVWNISHSKKKLATYYYKCEIVFM
jgi:hypothetical protein